MSATTRAVWRTSSRISWTCGGFVTTTTSSAIWAATRTTRTRSGTPATQTNAFGRPIRGLDPPARTIAPRTALPAEDEELPLPLLVESLDVVRRDVARQIAELRPAHVPDPVATPAWGIGRRSRHDVLLLPPGDHLAPAPANDEHRLHMRVLG